MPAAPHIARLRAKVGNDLLLLPSVAVLPIDDDDRVLLVRQTDFGSYGTIGGAVDEDEAPEDDEVDHVRWFARGELDQPIIGDFARSTFAALGWI